MAAIHEFPPQEQAKGQRKAFLTVEAHDTDERAELQLLRSQLLDAVGSKSQDAIGTAKRAYEARFPDEREAIETLFGMVGFLNYQRAIEEIRERDGGAPQGLYRSQTEYSFLMTHFVKMNGESRVFLDSFWTTLQEVSKRWGGDRGEGYEKRFRASIVTQVGISRAFDELHEDSSLSHPDEDMNRATDLWVEGRPVQVKGGKLDEPAFIEVDTMTYPATAVRDGRQIRLFTTHRDEKLDWLSLNVKRYSERIGRGMKGYFVVVPYKMVDWVTGKPTEELVEYFRVHLPGGSVSETARKAA